MKRISIFVSFILLLLIGLVVISCAKGPSEEEVARLKEIAGPPPASLDNLYPPKSPAPVFLLQMFAMAAPMEGIMIDLQQGDVANAQANYEKFKAEYTKASGMVPEWKDKYPMGPINALEDAMKSGDQAKLGAAFEEVGQVCGSCHMVNRTNVKFKYYWPDFEKVNVANPVTQQTQDWHDFMFFLAGSFTGIGNDLQQGQLDNARQNFQAFDAGFKALGQACSACHATPRTYFVDSSVQALVAQLGTELNKPAPNPQVIGELSGAIGNESCAKCHLVHEPAAFAKERWEMAE